MNMFHLSQKPGATVVKSLGGLHRMADWDGPIITDSGGFQAFSLIHQNPKLGQITDRHLSFETGAHSKRYILTPEKSIRLQLQMGADGLFCLDECTHVDAGEQAQVQAVKRTIAWARRCKDEFLRVIEQQKTTADRRPLLFGVVQGGASFELRRECAEALLEIGFDGFGFGGWPLDAEGNLLAEMLQYTRKLIPSQFSLHALGVGDPRNIAACAAMGYALFDSSMPTRDARHGRLYTFGSGDVDLLSPGGEWLKYVYLGDKKHLKNPQPLESGCDADCCTRFSLGYLHHLFRCQDPSFQRLATIHNLRFMTRLTSLLRADPRLS